MLTRRDILIRLARWIRITASTERHRRDFALARMATAADIRLRDREDARAAIYARDFFARTVAANAAAETLFLAADRCSIWHEKTILKD